MNKILLCLNGKRVEFAKVVEDMEGSFDWVAEVFIPAPNRDYVLIDYSEEQYQFTISQRTYYNSKSKSLKPMKETSATVSKASIENDGIDYVEYRVHTKEPMDVIVHQTCGTLRENAIFPLEPVNNIIVIRVTSDMLGTVRLAAIGDTLYTSPIDVNVI